MRLRCIKSTVFTRRLKSVLNPSCERPRTTQRRVTGGLFGFFLFMYDIQHCFIRRPSDSTVSEDAGIEPGQLRLRHWLSDALTNWLDLIHTWIDLIHIWLGLIHTWLDLIQRRAFLLFYYKNCIQLIPVCSVGGL